MSSSAASRRWRLAVRLTAAALAWSLGVVLAALLVPAYDASSSSPQGLTLTRATLVQRHGARALILVAIPMIVSIVVAVAIYGRHRGGPRWNAPVAWVAIGLLAAESVLGITTLGAFIAPVVILLALSFRLAPSPPRARDAPPRALATET
jgi:hypothetical protein